MLGHTFQLILGPGGVNIAVFVSHEIEVAGRYRDRLSADAEEAATAFRRVEADGSA